MFSNREFNFVLHPTCRKREVTGYKGTSLNGGMNTFSGEVTLSALLWLASGKVGNLTGKISLPLKAIFAPLGSIFFPVGV